MIGTSARIGEVLAIRKCDVDVTVSPATVRICGTIVSPRGKPTHRQHHPKAQKSTRTDSVPSFVAEVLRQRLVLVSEEDLEHLIFFSRNHTPLTTNNVRRPTARFAGGRRGRGRHPAFLPADRCDVPGSGQRPGPGGRDARAHVQQDHQGAQYPARRDGRPGHGRRLGGAGPSERRWPRCRLTTRKPQKTEQRSRPYDA